MFFDDWPGILRVLLVSTCAYLALIALLRISGKRTLARLNAFVFVVTIALGSTLATVLLPFTVALAEGVTALGLLIGLLYLVAWASVRNRRVERLVKSEPHWFCRHGFPCGTMRRQRVSVDERAQAARTQGHHDVRAVSAIVLETGGRLSIPAKIPSDLQPADPHQHKPSEEGQ